jgi:hypothetical protein
MAYWVYKCNRRKTSYSTDSGDWERWVFGPPWLTTPWGSIRKHPDLAAVAKGDLLLCQQSDVPKKLLVGVARVLGNSDGRLLVEPIERIGALIRPLKELDARIAAIPALQGGEIKTVYPIRPVDAQRLLSAGRAQVRARGISKAAPAKWMSTDEANLERTRRGLKELPAKDRAIAIREIGRIVRDARLRPAVLAHWPPECAACGCRIELDGLNECEVAHIRDVHKLGGDQIRNAVPLCRTHHWAFDRLVWAIRPTDHRVVVRKSLRKNSALRGIHGRKIGTPTSQEIDFLASDVVKWRWQRFARAARKDL